MSRFNIAGLLGAIGELPSVINRGLLGPLPVNPQLGLDPTQVQQAQDASLNDLAFGMLASPTRNQGLNLAYARNQARDNFSGRMVELLREQEFVRLKQEREDRQKAQDNLAALTVPGMEGVWENLSPQAREQIVVEKATQQTAPKEPPNSYQEFMLGPGGLIADPIVRAKAYEDWLFRKAREGATNISMGTTKPGSEASVAQVVEAVTQGESASKLVNSANTIRALLDDGAITGFGAEVRLDANRLLKLTGLNKGAAGKIANTETLRSELAWLAINARQQMKGQGQISDYESKMIEQAAGRDPNMTEEGIRTVLDVAERAGAGNIQNARTKVDILTSADQNLAPLKGTFDIRDPEPYEKSVVNDETGETIKAKRGIDGLYYWTDPKTGKKYRVEE